MAKRPGPRSPNFTVLLHPLVSLFIIRKRASRNPSHQWNVIPFRRSAEGRAALDRHQLLHCLYELCSLRSSDLYLKLILSSLDYSASEWGSREVNLIFLFHSKIYSLNESCLFAFVDIIIQDLIDIKAFMPTEIYWRRHSRRAPNQQGCTRHGSLGCLCGVGRRM